MEDEDFTITAEERAEGIRHAALHQAVAVVGGQGSPEYVLIAARQFEAYLKGEATEPQGKSFQPRPPTEVYSASRIHAEELGY